METFNRETAIYWKSVILWLRDETNKSQSDYEIVRKKVFEEKIVPFFQSRKGDKKNTPEDVLTDDSVIHFLESFIEESPSPTTLSKETRASQEELLIEQEKQRAGSQLSAEQKTGQFLKQMETARRILENPESFLQKNKNVTITSAKPPQTVELRPEVKNSLSIVKELATKHPLRFVTQLSREILEKSSDTPFWTAAQALPKKTRQDLAKLVSLDVADRLTVFDGVHSLPNQAKIHAALVQNFDQFFLPGTPKEIRDQIKDSLALEVVTFAQQEDVAIQSLAPLGWEEIAPLLYGGDDEEYQVSLAPGGQGNISLTHLVQNSVILEQEREERKNEAERKPIRIPEFIKNDLHRAINKFAKSAKVSPIRKVFDGIIENIFPGTLQPGLTFISASSTAVLAHRFLAPRLAFTLSSQNLLSAGAVQTTRLLGEYASYSTAESMFNFSNFSLTNSVFSVNFLSAEAGGKAVHALSFNIGKIQLQGLALSKSGQFLAGMAIKKGGQAILTMALGQSGLTITTTAATTAGETALAATGGAAAGIGTGVVVGQITIPIPVIGAVIGFVAGLAVSLIGKLVHWIKTHKEDVTAALATAGVLFLGPGVLLASMPLIIAGGTLLGASALSFGLARAAGVGLRGVGNLSIGLGRLALPSIGVPVIATFIGLPILVGLILFIINSGAYIVPPSDLFFSPIKVEKKITGEREFENSDLASGISVEYVVTVKSNVGALVNIQLSNECKVIRDGAKPPCENPLPSEIPELISPAEPYVFTYTVTYQDTNFEDSLVIDTFKVTAETSEGQEETSFGSANIIIGDPPTGCIVTSGFEGNSRAVNLGNLVLEAASDLYINDTAYLARVCSRGEVTVAFDPGVNPRGWGYFENGIVYLNGKSPLSVIDTKYILAHELGHYLSTFIDSSLLVEYKDTREVVKELPLCSYAPESRVASEGFAEAIALYATHDESSQWKSQCGGVFKDKYSNNWQFVNDKIY